MTATSYNSVDEAFKAIEQSEIETHCKYSVYRMKKCFAKKGK